MAKQPATSEDEGQFNAYVRRCLNSRIDPNSDPDYEDIPDMITLFGEPQPENQLLYEPSAEVTLNEVLYEDPPPEDTITAVGAGHVQPATTPGPGNNDNPPQHKEDEAEEEEEEEEGKDSCT
ncbi:uncharacterized protein [Panulirus ornatus]|uniref:uncharacterized protein n=1 Tax=Panulirus ornatus TaxID=150431 RepID=UPI003A836EDE